MNEWNQLPNAKHIDRVLASVKTNPQLWVDAYNSIEKTEQLRAAWGAARDAAWNAALYAAWDAALYAAWDAVQDAARVVAWGAAWGAALALVAYDDCAYMLDSDLGELAILVAFGDERAILLQTACIAFNKEKELV